MGAMAHDGGADLFLEWAIEYSGLKSGGLGMRACQGEEEKIRVAPGQAG